MNYAPYGLFECKNPKPIQLIENHAEWLMLLTRLFIIIEPMNFSNVHWQKSNKFVKHLLLKIHGTENLERTQER